MPTKRQRHFLSKVAEAARRARAARPRGKPTPNNLTERGRRKGLEAMQNARRCRSRTKAGHMCKSPAMRGPAWCLKHGGRTEVPEHQHNVRRFLNGQSVIKSAVTQSKRDFWESLTRSQKLEVLDVVPEKVANSGSSLYAAAYEWMQVRDEGCRAIRRFRMKYRQ